MSVSSNLISNTKKGIINLNEIKENSEIYKNKEEKNKEELPENKEVNLETANNIVKQLLTGFIFNLEKDDPEEYKNSLENFREKINSGNIALQDNFLFNKNFKTSNFPHNKKFFRRKTKRKSSFYTQMPEKYNLNSTKILENLQFKNDSNSNILSNRSLINLSNNNDFSNEVLIENKNGILLNKNNNNVKLPSKSQKKINFNLNNPKNKKFQFILEKEFEEKISPKSTRTKLPDISNKLNKKSSLLNKKKLFNLFKRPKLFNLNINEEENIKNNNLNIKNFLFKTRTFTSPINNKQKKNKIITSKTQKNSFSPLSSNSLSNNSENESETEINIANIRGLSKKNVQEINNIRIKLKDNMIGNKLSSKLNSEEINKSKNNISSNNSKIKKYKDKYRVLTRKNYVYDSLSDEEYDDEEGNSLIILPDSKFILILDFFISLSVIYDIIYIPYYLSYDKYFCGFSILNFHILIDLLISFIYIIDLFVNFFIAYYNFEEFLIKELKLIALNYISTYFIFDLIAAIPFKFYFFFKNYECKNLKSNLYNVDLDLYSFILTSLRILKLFKVYSKNKFINYCSRFLSNIHHFSQWGSIYLDIIVLFMGLHFVASLFIFIGRNQYPNWITELKLENSTFIHIYISSIYYLIATITTVGYGDITPSNQEERLFGLVLLIVGIIVYSFAVAGISNYIKEIDDKNADYDKKLKILEDIKINNPKLSDDLYEKVSRFLKYKHFNEKKDKNIIIDSLPLGLRNILIYEMYKPIIKNFIFFKNFDNTDFIVRVILAFKPILAMKNDILVKDGDFIEEIIFVKKGRLTLQIPIDIKTRSLSSNLITLNTINNIEKKDTIVSNYSLNSRLNKFSLNPMKTNSTKTFHLNDYLNNSSNKKISLEIKLKEEEEKEREREKNIQYVKILEIRKNEHFGDVLMFLNKRSPLCVKVKSKKVELYFLNKTDAIEISSCYPRIWNKINKKSLFNMEQIKKLINKVVKIFFSVHGIKEKESLNQELKFSSIISNENNYNSELNSISSITDSYYGKNQNSSNSFISNNSFNSQNKIKNNNKITGKKTIKSIVKEEENDDDNSSNYENNKVNNEIPVPNMNDHNLNIKNNNNINSKSFDEISSLNNNSFKTLKIENSGKNFFDFSEFGSLSDTILSYEKNYFSTNSHTNQTPFKSDEINDEIYPNENGEIINLVDFKFLNLKYKGQIINNKISKDYQFNYRKNNLYKSNSKKNEIIEINKGENIIFFDEKSSDQYSINNAINENIDNNFNNINIQNNNNENDGGGDDQLNLTFRNKNILKTVLLNKSLRDLMEKSPREKKSENNYNISIISTEVSFTINSEYENLDLLSNYKFSKSVELRNKIKKILIEDEKIIKNKKYNSTKKLSPLKVYSLHSQSSRIMNMDLPEKKNFQRKFHKSNSIITRERINEIDNSIVNNNKKKILQRKSNAFKNDKKPNLLNVISQNIEKNKMNLNNPDEFYSEYFSNILNKNTTKINHIKSSFINNTIQKNNFNILRRKSAANIYSLIKGISVDNERKKSSRDGN